MCDTRHRHVTISTTLIGGYWIAVTTNKQRVYFECRICLREWGVSWIETYAVTIPPTSAEVERVLSASGLFLIKLRFKLSDHTIDMLVFLKFYFARLQLAASG